MTPLQYSLLSALADHGVADQTTLARTVALDRTTTTGALRRLESRGLVQRVTSDRDRRSQACRLTHAGDDLLVAMEASARRAHDETLKALSAPERRQFVALLTRLVAAHDDEGAGPDLLPE